MYRGNLRVYLNYFSKIIKCMKIKVNFSIIIVKSHLKFTHIIETISPDRK